MFQETNFYLNREQRNTHISINKMLAPTNQFRPSIFRDISRSPFLSRSTLWSAGICSCSTMIVASLSFSVYVSSSCTHTQSSALLLQISLLYVSVFFVYFYFFIQMSEHMTFISSLSRSLVVSKIEYDQLSAERLYCFDCKGVFCYCLQFGSKKAVKKSLWTFGLVLIFYFIFKVTHQHILHTHTHINNACIRSHWAVSSLYSHNRIWLYLE